MNPMSEIVPEMPSIHYVEGEYEEVNKNIPTEVKVYLRALHVPHGEGEAYHAHFNDTSVLNRDGTWSNNIGFKLPECVINFLEVNNFAIPIDNNLRTAFTGPAKPIAYSTEEIQTLTGLKLPETMRKIDRAHNGAELAHIHFVRDSEGYEPVLNKNGTWDRPLKRLLNNNETAFIIALGWQLP